MYIVVSQKCYSQKYQLLSFQFAGELVKMGFSKVCVLHKGIDVMRPTGLMVVPPPQL